MSLLRHFKRSNRRKSEEVAKRLHHAIVGKARDPVLFGEDKIPDTFDGRFNAICLYSALLFPRLEKAGEKGQAISRILNDRVFSDIDGALRETGVGDASIARKVRKLGERFFGLARAAKEALESEQAVESLANVFERNEVTSPGGALEVAEIIVQDAQMLPPVADEALLAGKAPW